MLVFAEYEGNLDGKELTENATPIAFILLNNAIREGAMDTFRYFSKRGVEVKVISGDNPVTVSEIAKKAGIRHAEKQVDAATLKTAEAVRKAAKKYTVFGRVTPEQKRLLVQALKEQGKTVAMTGDGVNDILALKDADCSIAMASGSEAASHVAQLVLLDNDFNKMPAVVMEGRAIATMVFDSVAYKNVISNGLVLDKNGNKMSKRLGNAVDPFGAIEQYGSDPLRWYMITNSSPWDNLKFDTDGVDEVRRKFFGTLYNTYSFFALYANVDGFAYQEAEVPVNERPEIDRWILSVLNSLVKNVDACYNDYEPTKARSQSQGT